MPASSTNTSHQQKIGALITFPSIAMVLALIVFLIPLQHYFTMGRYQHYGLCIFIWGMGYILQVAWSWKRMLDWTRVSYLFGGLYITSLGIFFFTNPWLDIRMAVQTAEHDNLRLLARFIFCVLSIPLVIFWLNGLSEELHLQKSKTIKNKPH